MARRKRLGCPQCTQSYYADRPADNFTKVTLEPCEFPDYDFPAIAQCDNCQFEFAIYWHNLELERKHLLEIRELAYVRTRYVAYATAYVSLKLKLTDWFFSSVISELHGVKLPKKTRVRLVEISREAVKGEQEINDFMTEKLESSEIPVKEQFRFSRDSARRVNQLRREFVRFHRRRRIEVPSLEQK